jgi:hypothetical protein
MITKQQAINGGEFHYGICSKTVGLRGGVKYKQEVWRANGECKTWKRTPSRFCLPIKYGFRGPYGYLTDANCGAFHLASECPAERRFRVIEYASFFSILDKITQDEKPMGDGVDSVFDENEKAMSPGDPNFIEEWEKRLNHNLQETLEAYFPDRR